MSRIILPLLTLGLSLVPVLCWAAEPNADKAKAIAEIQKLGGKVAVDESSPGKPVISVDYKNTQVTDAGLAHLRGLTGLQLLGLGNTLVTDAGLVYVQRLTSLRVLGLHLTRVTDAGVARLRRALPNCQITEP